MPSLTARVGFKLAAALGLTLALTTAALILVSQEWARELGLQAADRSATALRQHARTSLERLTTEQARRYGAEFERTRVLSGLLATEAQALLAREPGAAGAGPAHDLTARRGMLTNGPDAPVSVVHLEGTRLDGQTREEMARLAHLDPLLRRARREGFSSASAWFVSERGYVRYAPNLPLIRELPREAGGHVLESSFYRAATPAENPEGRTVWTGVYQDPAGQGLMVTASTPVYGPSGDFRGVTGIDVTLDDIVDQLARGHAGGSASPVEDDALSFHFLIDAGGRIISFPPEQRGPFGLPEQAALPSGATLEHSLLESEHAALADFARRTLEGESRPVTRLRVDGHPVLLAMERVPASGWFLGHVVDEKGLMAGVEQTRAHVDAMVRDHTGSLTLLTVLLVALALLAMGTYLAVHLVRPLRRLAAAADGLRQGDYGVRVPTDRTDEVGQTAHAFNELSDRLAALIRDLESRVAQRTAEAEASRHHLQSILENSPVGICFLDGERYVRQANQAILDLFPYARKQVEGHTTRHLYAEDEEYQRVGREAYPALRAGDIYETTSRLKRADGTPFPVRLHGRLVNPERVDQGFIWVIQDISEQQRLEDELRLLATAFRNNQATFIAGADGTIERVNPGFCALTGYQPEEVVGRNPRMFNAGLQSRAFYQDFWRQLLEEGRWEGEIWNCYKDGTPRPVYESISVLRDAGGAIQHFVAVFHDISEQKRLEARLDHEASHDDLTGLYNRKRFDEELTRALEQAERYGNRFSILMFDIDHFKAVNDRFGHETGDRVLVRLAEQIHTWLRATDIPARWGGEEFMVLLPETGLEAALALAERLRAGVAESAEPPAVTITVSVAEYRPGESTDDLLRRLDAAVYRAKHEGRNRVRRA